MASPPDTLTDYEKSQRHNALTAWLHSIRYRHIEDVFRGLAAGIVDRPIRVLELGSANAKLFGVLDRGFRIDYTGIEHQAPFVAVARERYGARANFAIHLGSATDRALLDAVPATDIVVALETLEHIPEHDVVRLVERIAARAPRLFVCSVPVEIGPAIWLKNVGSALMGYHRHRLDYTWRDTFWAGLYQLDRIPPHGTDHIGFDWRWLAQTLRHNFRIVDTRRFPLRHLPSALATSMFFVCAPR